jgi:hypothetical protein
VAEAAYTPRVPLRRAICLATLLAALPAALLASTAAGTDGVAGAQGAKPLPRTPVPLKPGRYVTTVFKPKLTFALGPGWRVLSPEDPRFVTLVKGDLLFAFMRPIRVIDPARVYLKDDPPPDAYLPLPRDLVGWLANHPRLKASRVRSVVVGGVPSRQVDTLLQKGYRWRVCSEPCVLLFATRPDFIVYGGVGDKIRTTVSKVGGDTVAFGALASDERSFARVIGEGDQLLRSVRFGAH